jgi:hypothetical protein
MEAVLNIKQAPCVEHKEPNLNNSSIDLLRAHTILEATGMIKRVGNIFCIIDPEKEEKF